MKWISVKDRLPEYNARVLLLTNNYCHVGHQLVVIGYRLETNEFGDHYHCEWHHHDWPIDCIYGSIDSDLRCDGRNEYRYFCKKITHWMPLPEPPEEDA